MSNNLLQASTLELAKDLISRESVTPTDAGCQDLIERFLNLLDFKVERMDFEDTQNLWAIRQDAQPVLVFAGHTDVVPPGNLANWISPPFEPTIKDGQLFGRGAADMKGSIAAMMTATARFVKDYPEHKGAIAFLITSDEEGPFINGTVKVVEALMQRQQAIDFAIVGEPSSTQQLGDVIKIGRRGSLTGWLTVKGIQGHVAYPHLADNALHKAALLIDQLANIEWDKGNQYFPPTSLQVTQINAGEASNVVPGEAHLEFNLRYSTEQTQVKIQNQIETLVKQHCSDFELTWKLNGEPFITQSTELIQAVSQAVESVCGINPSAETSGGTSDGRFIAKTGAQVVEMGPINASIHQINENVNIDDLSKLSDIYYLTLKHLLT
ncbi:succinyl-diaminopimelate desuccinylase [Aliikangiella sp. IMCC44653]